MIDSPQAPYPMIDRFKLALRDAIADSVFYINTCLIEGDIAEFGVFKGVSASYFAEAIVNLSKSPGSEGQKKLHLFDSFKGLPESIANADKNSPKVKANQWPAGGLIGPNSEKIKQIVSNHSGLGQDQIETYEGWFHETVSELTAETKFALLHIDCDLYQSTLDCLVPCLERKWISEGATIMFDDWNSNRGSPNWGERKAWSELVERFQIEFSDEGSYRGIGHKFIVHKYKS